MSPPPPATDAERLGDQYMAKNMAQAAIPQFEKAQAAGASTASTAWRLGNAYFTLRQWEKALDAFEQALVADPTLAIAFEGAGFAAFELGKFTEATLYFEQTTELAPSHWVPHAFLAALYRLQGDMVRATASKDKCLELAGEANKLMAVETIKRALVKGIAKKKAQGEKPGDSDSENAQGLGEPTEPLPGEGAPAAFGAPAATSDDILDPLSSDMDILGLDSPTAPKSGPAPAASGLQAASAKGNATVAVITNEAVATEDDNTMTAAGDPTAAKVAPAPTAKVAPVAAGKNATAMADTPTTALNKPEPENAAKAPAGAGNATAAASPKAPAATVAKAGAAPPKAVTAPPKAMAAPPKAMAAPPKAVDPRTMNATMAAGALPVPPANGASQAAPAAAPVNGTAAPSPSSKTEAKSPASPAVTTATTSAPSKAAATKPASSAEPAQAPAPSTPGNTSDDASKAKAPAPSSGKSVSPPATPKPGEPFVYSVLESSWRHRDEAIVRSNTLKKRGIRAQIMRADLGKSGVYYRVMIGVRKNKQDIVKIKDELQNRFGLKDIIILRIRPGSLEE